METVSRRVDQLGMLAETKPGQHNKSISQLRDDLKGRIITPEDTDYDPVRIRLSIEAVRRPALIVRPMDAGDVSRVVLLARDTGMELAIRSCGHSLAGFSTSEGGIVFDLSQMKGLKIDVEERTVWAEAGLTAGEYTAETAKYGLATGFGDRTITEHWLEQYNTIRPHEALQGLPPRQYAIQNA